MALTACSESLYGTVAVYAGAQALRLDVQKARAFNDRIKETLVDIEMFVYHTVHEDFHGVLCTEYYYEYW